jgi:hypothetical protein
VRCDRDASVMVDIKPDMDACVRGERRRDRFVCELDAVVGVCSAFMVALRCPWMLV